MTTTFLRLEVGDSPAAHAAEVARRWTKAALVGLLAVLGLLVL